MNKDVRQGQAQFELLMRQFRAPRKLCNIPYLHGGKHSSGGLYWQKKKPPKKTTEYRGASPSLRLREKHLTLF